MVKEYIRQPRTIVQLAEQVKVVCDDYWNGEIIEDTLRDYLDYTAVNAGLLENGILNPSIKTIIGKKRLRLVKAILNLK